MATVRSIELLARLEIDDLDVILGEKRLCWFGHNEQSSGAIKTICDMQIEGKHGPGRPKRTLRTLTERDHLEWKLNEVDPCNRDVWRSSVRSAMHAASKLLEGAYISRVATQYCFQNSLTFPRLSTVFQTVLEGQF